MGKQEAIQWNKLSVFRCVTEHLFYNEFACFDINWMPKEVSREKI